MSSITTLNNNAYYQLSNPSAGAGGGGQTNPTDALLQALSQSGNAPQASSSSDAFLLDLSPQAQQYMNGSASTVNPLASSASFTLTAQQQQAITNILEQYKNAPYTQATFDQIQNDLQAAGLDPAKLSRIDQAQSFNPTQLLVDDLNGNYSGANAMINPDESTKSSNYMQQIISRWQTISGNTPTSGSATATGAA